MKRMISFFAMAALSVSLVACGKGNESSSTQSTIGNEESSGVQTQAADLSSSQSEGGAQTTESAEAESTEAESTEAESTEAERAAETNRLVVYFSATGNTRAIAESIADGIQADIYEIIPEEPYTSADLNYNDSNSRSTKEMNDSSARPQISGSIDNFDQYEIVFLGYPIWWGEAPRILDTFVESYDFTGKTVIPFCTSASSGIGSSADTLETLAGSGTWMDGQRFGANESSGNVVTWAEQFLGQ